MNRNNIIKVRLTDEELNDLEQKSKLTGYNKSKYIRCLLSNKIPKQYNPIDYKSMINTFNVIGKQLTEISLNNQNFDSNIDIRNTINCLDALIKKIDNELRVPNK